MLMNDSCADRNAGRKLEKALARGCTTGALLGNKTEATGVVIIAKKAAGK